MPTSVPTATTRSCAGGRGCRERRCAAPDIRAGAGLVIAGLVADGETTVSEIHHIDRGYPGFDAQLRALGADVVREPDPDAFHGLSRTKRGW